ncbi:MAG: hydroxyacid dehydrogenase [Ruminococcaceae bacterium]|nr:hydroxyacid dehydrogenase [Oscillospiraceae bacterium]
MKACFAGSKEKLLEVYPDYIRKQLSETYGLEPDFVLTQENLSTKTERARDIDYIFSTWNMPSWSAEEIKAYLPNLKAVFYAAGTVQYFAKPFLENGVRVFSAWKANGLPVAEYTFAQIILANKKYFQYVRKNPFGWMKKEKVNISLGNYKFKVGILGDGAIGSEVIDRLKTLECDIYLFSITKSAEEAEKEGIHLCSLAEIFKECDVISNHLANNPQTQKMITKELLCSMKPDATFINTGRGAQVDEKGLCIALMQEPQRTALLDVTHPEPPEFYSPLWYLPNVFMTPHIAGSLGQEVWRMADYMYKESIALTNNQDLHYEVTAEMLKTMA